MAVPRTKTWTRVVAGVGAVGIAMTVGAGTASAGNSSSNSSSNSSNNSSSNSSSNSSISNGFNEWLRTPR